MYLKSLQRVPELDAAPQEAVVLNPVPSARSRLTQQRVDQILARLRAERERGDSRP